MHVYSWKPVSSPMYECSQCLFTSRRANCERHFIINHVRGDQVPWQCSLCGFRTLTEPSLDKHVTLDIHKRALTRKPNDHTVFMKSKNPYRVEIGKDIFLVREDLPNYFNSRSSASYNRASSRQNDSSTNRHEPVYKTGDYSSPRNSRARRRDSSSVERAPKRKRSKSNSRPKRTSVETLDPIQDGDGSAGRQDSGSKSWGEVHSTTNIQSEPKTDVADDTVLAGIQRNNVAESVDMLIQDARERDRMPHPLLHYGFGHENNGFDMVDMEGRGIIDQQLMGNPFELNSDGSKLIDIPMREEQCLETSTQGSNNIRSSQDTNTFIDRSINIKHDPSETQTNIFKTDVGSNVQDGADLHSPCAPADENCMENDEQEQIDQEGLEDKVSGLIQALEPLKNISKALIALDHHLRRMMPMLETLMPPGRGAAGAPASVKNRSYSNCDPRLRTRPDP